ncbi:unnamed protein product [Prorocentrum cordatum]|uniref:Uncharacterized protein n=1 Tax=Prorocentrum cordatum TaxID=2364126 RepID=A0ABN9Y821_9DINO|nr:unnamed protein product [Polarella glacialis]
MLTGKREGRKKGPGWDGANSLFGCMVVRMNTGKKAREGESSSQASTWGNPVLLDKGEPTGFNINAMGRRLASIVPKPGTRQNMTGHVRAWAPPTVLRVRRQDAGKKKWSQSPCEQNAARKLRYTGAGSPWLCHLPLRNTHVGLELSNPHAACQPSSRPAMAGTRSKPHKHSQRMRRRRRAHADTRRKSNKPSQNTRRLRGGIRRASAEPPENRTNYFEGKNKKR